MSVRRDDDKRSNITHGSASMRRTSGYRPGMAVIGMPLLAITARQRHKKDGALSGRGCAGYRNRPTTVTRTSTHCGSPLWIENARSLRPGMWRVNLLQNLAGGIAGFFRKGSALKICIVHSGPFAGKPAPTTNIYCRSWLVGSPHRSEGGGPGQALAAMACRR